MPGDFSYAVCDADQYQLSFAGVNLSQGAGQSGYGQDEFFKVALVSDAFADDVGVDGAYAVQKTNDRRVEAYVTFLQTASANAFLSGLYATDTDQPNGAGVGSMQLKDLQGTTLFLATRMRIFKPADIVLGRGVKARQWKFRGLYSVYLVGGN